ncbi:MAG: hypothetical protein ACJ78Q_01400 [Chloroflexia bacterium]
MFRSKMLRIVGAWACLAVALGALSLAGAQIGAAQAAVTGDEWQKVEGAPADVDFRNVFMASQRSGLAVGKQVDRGVMYELEWTPVGGANNLLNVMPVGFSFRAPLWAVVQVNQDAWAVGEKGLIVHRQNGVWSEVASPVPDAQLLALQMLGNGEEGWAGGFVPRAGGGRPEPVVLHYLNGRWERDNSVNGEGSINALHFAPGGGWAVGDAGIWHYRNGQWTKEQEPNPCPETGCYPTYSAVRAVSGDEAWIAGIRMAICGICVPEPYMLHRVGGKWQIAVDTNVAGDPTRPGAGRELYGLTFSEPGGNAAMTGWAVGLIRDNFDLKPYILRGAPNSQGEIEWQYVPYPAGVNTQLTSVSAPDLAHAMAVGTGGAILSYGYGKQSSPSLTPTRASTSTTNATPTVTPQGGGNPTRRVPDPHNPNVTYFPLVGHTLRGGFRDYWRAHGGLAQFGYPLTEEFSEVSPTDGKAYVTQYFERARFEYHPENKPPYDVLLGLLGRTVTQGREGETAFKRAPEQAAAGTIYFAATGHNMPVQFSGYWQQHGGLPVYGYPISEAFTEVSPTDGKPYLVQYFERNRLEYHPELPAAYRVSLGLLGVQVLQQRGWIR